MKKLVLAAVSASAALALSACGGAADEGADGEVITAEETTVIEDTPDTVVVDDADADGDSISISEDGVSADINDGGTSVNADISGDPSLTVETD